MPETEEPVKKPIKIGDTVVIKDFATMLDKPVTEVVAELMRNGIMLSMNERIDYDTASIIAEDFGFAVEKGVDTTDDHVEKQAVDLEKLQELLESDKTGEQVRPPVVVVMGHVDHGKTTLLDAIRDTEVAAGEAGGITQAIGAYQVEARDRLITFIDTPGHEAFTAMRSRGANVADVAILVVAADDGLKPQTHEALEIIQKAELPFVVAINKIDKPGANIQKVKTELAEIGLVPEEFGGKTVVADISAKNRTGIQELLDMVLLVADLHEQKLKTNAKKSAVGTIIESNIDKGAGAVATVLVQSGTLKVGDLVTAGLVPGKIRSIRNWKGEDAQEATPSMPVQILGLKEAPVVGDVLQVIDGHKTLRAKVKEHAKRKRPVKQMATPTSNASEGSQEEEEDEPEVRSVKVVLKTDTLGSQEAILGALEKLQHDEVQWQVVKKGLGIINENDVLESLDHGAFVAGFNVSVKPGANEVATEKEVEIKDYDVIYHLINDVEERMEDLLEPEVINQELGKLKVLAIFTHGKARMIVGGKVTDGKIQNNAKVRIFRKGEKIGDGEIEQLQADKKAVPEATAGSECGMKVHTSTPIEEGDTFEVYIHEIRKRKLTDPPLQAS